MVDGIDEGGVESSNPMVEKHSAAIIIPTIKISRFSMVAPIITPTIIGTADMMTPKMNEAIMFPSMIVDSEIGVDTNLSRVLMVVSHGIITGLTAVAVKNRVIANNPETSEFIGIFLPIENAKNKNRGINTPKMITGPLK